MFHFALRVSEEASLYNGYCPEEDAGVAEQIQYCLCNEGADIACSSDAYILDCSIKDANLPNAVIKRCECWQKNTHKNSPWYNYIGWLGIKHQVICLLNVRPGSPATAI